MSTRTNRWDRHVLTICASADGFHALFISAHSEHSSENELTDVSCVCSQPSRHPTQLQSSFHSSSSIRQDSIPRESTCQWYEPVPFALIPEFPIMLLISKFRPEIPVFEVLPLHEPLAPLDPLFSLLVPLDCPLDFPA